jgi:hypothetical protein
LIQRSSDSSIDDIDVGNDIVDEDGGDDIMTCNRIWIHMKTAKTNDMTAIELDIIGETFDLPRVVRLIFFSFFDSSRRRRCLLPSSLAVV